MDIEQDDEVLTSVSVSSDTVVVTYSGSSGSGSSGFGGF